MFLLEEAVHIRVARSGQYSLCGLFDLLFFTGSELLWKIDALHSLPEPNDVDQFVSKDVH